MAMKEKQLFWKHIVNSSGEEFLVFCDENQDSLAICVSDGYNIFQHEIADHLQFGEFCCSSKEDFISKLRSAMCEGKIRIHKGSESVHMSIESSDDTFEVTCYPTTASDRKQMYQNLFFCMASKLEHLEIENKELSAKVKQIENDHLTHNATVLSESHFGGPHVNEGRTTNTKVKRGGSIINPGTKRKKKATGVVFDDD